MMLRISKILFGVYVFLLILYLGIHYLFLPLVLLTIFVSSIFLIIAVIQLLISMKKRKAIRQRWLTVVLLLIPLLGIFFYDNVEWIEENEILSAYTDGPISGADITFYENNKMKYCSMSLLGEKCYLGKYELNEDTFLVTYSNGLPNIKSTKMVKMSDKFVFLDEENEAVYEFYLDDF